MNNSSEYKYYACPFCKQSCLEYNGSKLICCSCRREYTVHSGIPDLFHAGHSSIDTEYTVDFTSEFLYKTSQDLETRVKYFNTRFVHSVDCENLTTYLNSNSTQVLEVGCGTLRPLLPVGNKYVPNQTTWGVDLSWALLLRAKENSPETHLCRANASILPFNDKFFDLIWARHMLYHVEDPEAVLKECCRSLKHDGVFCLSTNSRYNKPEMHQFHKRLIESLELEVVPSSQASRHFAAEEAERKTGEFFEYVIGHPYDGSFEFASTDEFLEYYISTPYFGHLVLNGFPHETLTSCARIILRNSPILKMSNNGTIMFATNSLKKYHELQHYLS